MKYLKILIIFAFLLGATGCTDSITDSESRDQDNGGEPPDTGVD